MSDSLTKEDIRRAALERRDALTDEDRATRSLAICEAVMEDDRFVEARGLHVYLPVSTEVDIKPLITVAWEMGTEVGLMRVQPDGKSDQYRILPDTDYDTGPYGILVPHDAESFNMDICDAVIVPIVAADEGCNRIGYGKGYYDRFLTHNPRPSIGVAFDVQIVEEIPANELDITLDCIYTESRQLLPS